MPAGLVRKPWACSISRRRPLVWSGAMPTKLIWNKFFFFHGVEENLIPFQLWRDPLGFWAEMRLRSKYLVLAESSAQFGFKLLVITDFQLQIAHRFLVLPQGRFLCTYANPCFRIFGSYSRESGATALEVRVCDVACFKPYFIFSLWYSVWWLAGGLHPPGISNDFSPTKKKNVKKWFWKHSLCACM